MSKITVNDMVFDDWKNNYHNYHTISGSVKRMVSNNPPYISIEGIYIDTFLDKTKITIFATSQKLTDLEGILKSADIIRDYKPNEYTVAELQDKVDNFLMKIDKLKAFI